MNPKVSIVIPVYNGSNYLKQAIDSALAQTYKNIEIIVINDGSNDEGATEAIAKSYGNKIRYFKKENGGVATALNLGIKKMTGEYFSWLSHDDMYYPEKIEKQIGPVKVAGEDTIIISDWTGIDKLGSRKKYYHLDDRLETSPVSFLEFDRKTWLNGCAMLIPASIFHRYGCFDETLKTTQDYDLWFRLMKSGVVFKILHQPLLYSRIHSEQGSLVNPSALSNSDRMHSNIAQSLSVCEIEKYFKDNYHDMVSTYDTFLANGYKKTPPYIINNIVHSMINKGETDSAFAVIQDKLMGEGVSVDSVYVSEFIDKIAKKSSKKRIMYCSGHWLTGGMERVLSILFNELHDRYDIYLITPYDGRISKIPLPDYITHIRISNVLFGNRFDTVILSYALILDIDVVIGFMNLFEKQLDFYNLCSGTGIKTIAASHEYYFYPYKSEYHYPIVIKRLEMFNRADVAVWETNFSAAVYGQYNDNGFLLPNPNAFQVQAGSKGKKAKKIVLCVGRFNDYVKRVDRIINCFALVLAREPDAKLVLVGKCDRDLAIKPGDSTTINDLIKRLDIDEKSINFVGEVNNVKDYYAEASLLLLTSNSEGFGMVVNEAACFGVPAVCNNIPGLEDIIIDGKNGFLVKQDDINTMADYVCQILSDNKLRNELSKNAKKLAERFNAATIGNKWEYLIDSMLKERSKASLYLELNRQLSYEVSDYKIFSKILATELNEIFNIVVPTRTVPCVESRRAESYISRIVASIKYEGYASSFKKALVRVLWKVKGLFR